MKLKHLSAIALAAAALTGVMPANAQTETETWKPIGNGLLRDDFLTYFYILHTYYEFPVEMQESEQTPGRYRLVNAYKNCPSIGGPDFPAVDNYVVVDASDPVHVYIEPGCVSYYMGQDQALCLWSIAEDYYHNLYGDWTKADEEGICGTLADGVITFPPGTVLATPIEGALSYDPAVHDLLWVQGNQHNMFRIKLPGTPNTDISLDILGLNDTEDGVKYDITFGSDIEYVKVGVFEGDYTPSMREDVENDRVKTYKIDVSDEFTVPYEKDGNYTLVAVPYAQDRSWTPSYITREWSYSQAEWKNVGNCTYTEAILASNELSRYGFVVSPYTYQVPVQQNVEKPWMIRLVDPYGPDCYPNGTIVNYDTTKHYYLVFDLGTFDCVHLNKCDNIGLDYNQGRMAVRSRSDYSMTENPYGPNLSLAEYMANPELPRGRYNPDNKTVVFDKEGLCIKFIDRAPGWYYANLDGTTKIVLPSDIVVTPNPDVSSVAGIESDDDAPAEYFTIDGIKVDADNLGNGVYLVRKGSKVSKVFVK